jgi:MFS family permease
MNFRYLFKSARKWVSELTVGGSWGKTQPAAVQRNLHWFWFDGLFAAAHDNIYANYISLYVLVLGATEVQVGLMSSFSNLAAALLLLPGAFIAERFVSKKKAAMLFIGGLSRLSILLLVFVPMFFKGASLVWAAIFFSVLRDSFANLGYPAWMAVTNEIVPIEGRGRFFGSRNFIMSVAGILVTLLIGKLITVFTGQLGYQIALGVAFVMGVSSAFSYAHIGSRPSPSPLEGGKKLSLPRLFNDLRGQSQFLLLVLTAAIWNFAINVSAPFFNVHMLQELHFTASQIGLLNAVVSLSALLVQNKLGSLVDRFGARRLQLLSMLLIPLLPLGWIFATKVWHIALLNVFNGFFWGAYNLASFNLLLEFMPSDKVPLFSAVYQVLVALSLALGALAGSGVVAHWGFIGVLVVTIIIRWLAAGLFSRLVPAQNTAASKA